MQEWIDTYLNVPLRIELLKRAFLHEFGFESNSSDPPETALVARVAGLAVQPRRRRHETLKCAQNRVFPTLGPG